MKTAFQIFRRDVRRLLKNRAATLVMIGVCLLPSLYAWFNIAANMDPYANTSGIRVAIANCDTGPVQGSRFCFCCMLFNLYRIPALCCPPGAFPGW